MSRVPKMARGKISLEGSIHCSPNIFISFAESASPYREEHVYIHIQISYFVQTVHELPLPLYNTVVKHFYTNRSGANC